MDEIFLNCHWFLSLIFRFFQLLEERDGTFTINTQLKVETENQIITKSIENVNGLGRLIARKFD